MELNEAFSKSLLAFIKNGQGGEPQEVIDYDEGYVSSGGGCKTCYFEWTVVDVKYRDADGSVKECRYNGDFMEFVNELLRLKTSDSTSP